MNISYLFFFLVFILLLYLGRQEVIRREQSGQDVLYDFFYKNYFNKYSYRYGNNIENFKTKKGKENDKDKTNTKNEDDYDILEIDEEEDKKQEKNREGWDVLDPIEDIEAAVAWAIWGFELMLYFISFMMCSFIMIMSIWDCFKWYVFNLILTILYFTYGVLFSITGTTDIEDDYWNFIYYIDGICYKNAGFHIAHFPDSVIAECYSCPILPFPTLPSEYMSMSTT
jgi:hypothetical protein